MLNEYLYRLLVRDRTRRFRDIDDCLDDDIVSAPSRPQALKFFQNPEKHKPSVRERVIDAGILMTCLPSYAINLVIQGGKHGYYHLTSTPHEKTYPEQSFFDLFPRYRRKDS